MNTSIAVPGSVNVGVIQKTEGAATVNLERIALDTDILTFAAVPALTNIAIGSPTTSGVISCAGKSQIIVKTEYSGAQVIASLFVLLQDSGGVIVAFNPKVEPGNTGDQTMISTAGWYHGEMFSVPTRGAQNFLIRLGSGQPGTAGSVSVWTATI